MELRKGNVHPADVLKDILEAFIKSMWNGKTKYGNIVNSNEECKAFHPFPKQEAHFSFVVFSIVFLSQRELELRPVVTGYFKQIQSVRI